MKPGRRIGLHGRGPTVRVTEHSRGADAQVVEEMRQVRCKLRSAIGRGKSATPPVAAQIRNDHAMELREMLDECRLEHLAAHHHPMHEQEGPPRSVFGEVEKV